MRWIGGGGPLPAQDLPAGLGYGWLTERGHSDLATMARGGFVYHFGKRFSAGLEATYQKLDGSALEFWSFGSAMAFGF